MFHEVQLGFDVADEVGEGEGAGLPDCQGGSKFFPSVVLGTVRENVLSRVLRREHRLGACLGLSSAVAKIVVGDVVEGLDEFALIVEGPAGAGADVRERSRHRAHRLIDVDAVLGGDRLPWDPEREERVVDDGSGRVADDIVDGGLEVHCREVRVGEWKRDEAFA